MARAWLPVVAATVAVTPAFAQSAPRTQPIAFENMGVVLRGTLYLPATRGPHPAVVTVHGSGPDTRYGAYTQEIAQRFPTEGIAVLAFDKRGSGESGGEYAGSYSSSMVIYAMDVLAGVDSLRAHPRIDADRIGLWGMSQAGWIIPIAAAVAKDKIAFTIIASGPTVSINEENAYSDLTGDHQRRPSGLSAEEIRRQLATVEPLGLDASAFIAELRKPGLWLYGDLDKSVPWEQGLVDLQAIKDEWDRDFTWHVFPGANHGLRKAKTGGSWERPVPREMVDGYFEVMLAWLREKGVLPQRPSSQDGRGRAATDGDGPRARNLVFH